MYDNMGGKTLSQSSYIRQLPYSAVRQLSCLLDPGDLWERFVERIPKVLDAKPEDFDPRFSYNDVQLFAQNGMRKGASPTASIISDWGTKNVTLRHLINVLVDADLYAAADHIAVNVLKGEPVPRRQTPSLPLTPVEQDEMAVGQRDAEADHQAGAAGNEEMPGQQPAVTELRWDSGFPSVDLQACESSPLQGQSCPDSRQAVEDEENEAMGRFSLEDIILQEVKYSLLTHITNNFDGRPLSAGGRLLGHGGFGVVYLGQFHNGMKTAVKVLKQEAEDVEEQFEREVAVLSQYRNEHIVHLLAYSRDGPTWCLVYEYMVNGSLEDRLACRDGTPPLSVKQRLSIAVGTARGIAYLNNQGLVHRDIKSANVLLSSDFTPKIADVATTRMAPLGTGNTRKQTSVVMGTSAYLAPEAYQFDVSAKLDSFSFGVILIELLTGLPPYDVHREEKDIRSYVEEFEGDLMRLVDDKAGEWDPTIVEALHELSESCNERKRKRPLVAGMLDRLTELEKMVS